MKNNERAEIASAIRSAGYDRSKRLGAATEQVLAKLPLRKKRQHGARNLAGVAAAVALVVAISMTMPSVRTYSSALIYRLFGNAAIRTQDHLAQPDATDSPKQIANDQKQAAIDNSPEGNAPLNIEEQHAQIGLRGEAHGIAYSLINMAYRNQSLYFSVAFNKMAGEPEKWDDYAIGLEEVYIDGYYAHSQTRSGYALSGEPIIYEVPLRRDPRLLPKESLILVRLRVGSDSTSADDYDQGDNDYVELPLKYIWNEIAVVPPKDDAQAAEWVAQSVGQYEAIYQRYRGMENPVARVDLSAQNIMLGIEAATLRIRDIEMDKHFMSIGIDIQDDEKVFDWDGEQKVTVNGFYCHNAGYDIDNDTRTRINVIAPLDMTELSHDTVIEIDYPVTRIANGDQKTLSFTFTGGDAGNIIDMEVSGVNLSSIAMRRVNEVVDAGDAWIGIEWANVADGNMELGLSYIEQPFNPAMMQFTLAEAGKNEVAAIGDMQLWRYAEHNQLRPVLKFPLLGKTIGARTDFTLKGSDGKVSFEMLFSYNPNDPPYLLPPLSRSEMIDAGIEGTALNMRYRIVAIDMGISDEGADVSLMWSAMNQTDVDEPFVGQIAQVYMDGRMLPGDAGIYIWNHDDPDDKRTWLAMEDFRQLTIGDNPIENADMSLFEIVMSVTMGSGEAARERICFKYDWRTHAVILASNDQQMAAWRDASMAMIKSVGATGVSNVRWLARVDRRIDP